MSEYHVCDIPAFLCELPAGKLRLLECGRRGMDVLPMRRAEQQRLVQEHVPRPEMGDEPGNKRVGVGRPMRSRVLSELC